MNYRVGRRDNKTISTLTTSTISAIANPTGATLGTIAVFALIGFLIQREIAAAGGPQSQRFARDLMVVITPLVVIFIAVVAVRLGGLR